MREILIAVFGLVGSTIIFYFVSTFFKSWITKQAHETILIKYYGKVRKITVPKNLSIRDKESQIESAIKEIESEGRGGITDPLAIKHHSG